MAKVETTFRGKTVEELNNLSLEQFGQLCNSRARRNLKNGFDKKFIKKVEKTKNNPKAKPVRTHKRDIIVIPAMIGGRVALHRGNSFDTIEIEAKMLGHYLGELVLTRKKLQHGKAGIGATKSSTAVTARG